MGLGRPRGPWAAWNDVRLTLHGQANDFPSGDAKRISGRSSSSRSGTVLLSSHAPPETPSVLSLEEPATRRPRSVKEILRPGGSPLSRSPLCRSAPLPLSSLRQLLPHVSPAPDDTQPRLTGGGKWLRDGPSSRRLGGRHPVLPPGPELLGRREEGGSLPGGQSFPVEPWLGPGLAPLSFPGPWSSPFPHTPVPFLSFDPSRLTPLLETFPLKR